MKRLTFFVVCLFLVCMVSPAFADTEVSDIEARVTKNTDDILQQQESIRINRQDIDTNTWRIDGLEGRVNSLERSMEELNERINDVGAMSMAAANLHYQFAGDDKFALAMAAGFYRDAKALAVGGAFRPRQNIMLSVSVSVNPRDNSVGGGAGVCISF